MHSVLVALIIKDHVQPLDVEHMVLAMWTILSFIHNMPHHCFLYEYQGTFMDCGFSYSSYCNTGIWHTYYFIFVCVGQNYSSKCHHFCTNFATIKTDGISAMIKVYHSIATWDHAVVWVSLLTSLTVHLPTACELPSCTGAVSIHVHSTVFAWWN